MTLSVTSGSRYSSKDRDFLDAVDNRYIKIVQRLMGSVSAKAKNKALLKCCTCVNVEVLKILLADKAVDPSADRNEALVQACKQDDAMVPTIELLLKDSRVDPSAYGHRVLCEAFSYGIPEVVSTLCKDPRLKEKGKELNREYEEEFNRLCSKPITFPPGTFTGVKSNKAGVTIEEMRRRMRQTEEQSSRD